MRALIQRVTSAKVSIEGITVGECGYGLLVYQSICCSDTETLTLKFIDKLLKLRLFPDDAGKTNWNIEQISHDGRPKLLLISNFSLYADLSKSLRPSFSSVKEFEEARIIYNKTIEVLSSKNIPFATGKFGGNMTVESISEVFNVILDINC